MHKVKTGQQLGFTLIELLIVMAIMGILAVAGIGGYRSSMAKTRDSKRKNDLRQISLGLEAYFNDHNQYPASDAQGRIIGCGPVGAKTVCDWGDPFSETSGATYMNDLPKDPVGTQSYFYVESPPAGGSNANGYFLYALVEDTHDNGAGVAQRGYNFTNCSRGGTTKPCTYGVPSSNRYLGV